MIKLKQSATFLSTAIPSQGESNAGWLRSTSPFQSPTLLYGVTRPLEIEVNQILRSPRNSKCKRVYKTVFEMATKWLTIGLVETCFFSTAGTVKESYTEKHVLETKDLRVLPFSVFIIAEGFGIGAVIIGAMSFCCGLFFYFSTVGWPPCFCPDG